MSERLPIVILGGSDRQASTVPQQLSSAEMLSGFKGAAPLPWGRTLAGELIHRIGLTQRFARPILIGPQRVYQGQVDADVVDAEGSLVVTIRTAMRAITQRFDPAQPVAIMACDVLPTVEELQAVLDDDYQPHRQCMFWWQLVPATRQQLAASHWKPAYPIRPTPDSEPLTLYPGHLVILRPQSLRVGLASSLLELAYRYRNRDIRRRYIPLALRSLSRLLAEDLRNLFRLQLPVLTVSLPCRGLWGYYRFRRGKLTLAQCETNLARLLLHRQYHHAAGGRPVVVAISPVLSLAKDIDTHGELAEAIMAGPAE